MIGGGAGGRWGGVGEGGSWGGVVPDVIFCSHFYCSVAKEILHLHSNCKLGSGNHMNRWQ